MVVTVCLWYRFQELAAGCESACAGSDDQGLCSNKMEECTSVLGNTSMQPHPTHMVSSSRSLTPACRGLQDRLLAVPIIPCMAAGCPQEAEARCTSCGA